MVIQKTTGGKDLPDGVVSTGSPHANFWVSSGSLWGQYWIGGEFYGNPGHGF